jgi:hypothetical protein
MWFRRKKKSPKQEDLEAIKKQHNQTYDQNDQ